MGLAFEGTPRYRPKDRIDKLTDEHVATVEELVAVIPEYAPMR